jgi:serine/threonine-protein kinase
MDSVVRSPAVPARIVGRYALYEEIASGGMATVHLGRLLGPVGFSRTVAIKMLHPQFAKDPDFAAMFIDEAHLASRVRHPNVVQMLDVVSRDGEILLVMEYVHGESFAFLQRALEARGKRLPARVTCNIVAAALQGLHAAHEAVGEGGMPLGIVHRDVSPQNILVGVDGVARMLDFGVAKAIGRAHATREGQIKGKLRYMAPEQILGGEVGPRTDLWAASVMLWEALTGQRLFSADNDVALLRQVLEKPIASPRTVAPELPRSLADIVLAGLKRDPSERIGSALEMATRLEDAVGLASPREIAAWVQAAARAELAARAKRVADVESVRAVSTIAPVQTTIPPTPQRAARSFGRALAIFVLTLSTAAAGLWLARAPVALGVDEHRGGAAGQDSTAAPAAPVAAPSPAPSPAPVPTSEPSAAVPVAGASASAIPAIPAATASGRGAGTRPGGASTSSYRVPLYGRD